MERSKKGESEAKQNTHTNTDARAAAAAAAHRKRQRQQRRTSSIALFSTKSPVRYSFHSDVRPQCTSVNDADYWDPIKMSTLLWAAALELRQRQQPSVVHLFGSDRMDLENTVKEKERRCGERTQPKMKTDDAKI